MKKRISILCLWMFVIAATAAAAKNVSLSKAELLNKVKGAWAGQTIGCTYGGPTEFKYKGQMIPDSVEIKWPEHQCKWYFDNDPGLYDDIYMDLTFVEVYEREGLDAPLSAFVDAFANAGYPLFHANQSARYNILMEHLTPPASGFWKNNPHADDIDFQIEADFSGIMSPGMPNSAISFGDSIGHMMNYGDGWYGGVFVGAMYALSYISTDIPYIVSEALKAVPRQSKFHQCVSTVLEGYRLYPDNWKMTWQLVQDRWGLDSHCPDGLDSPFNIDAKLNSAYIAIALLYGHGDFGRTIDIATRCGQDSDCNPSSAGGILGCIIGYDSIPEKWMKPLREVEDMPFKYTDISLHKAYEMSFRQAQEVIRRNGGKVLKDRVIIKTQAPKTVRLEQSFPGVKLVKKVKFTKTPLDKIGEIRFTGTGIVLRGHVKADDDDYVALADIYIDGRKMKTASLPASFLRRTNDYIYVNYDLPRGEHTLTLRRLNPQDNVSTRAWDYEVYDRE